jgi:signal transduction histidine kinase
MLPSTMTALTGPAGQTEEQVTQLTRQYPRSKPMAGCRARNRAYGGTGLGLSIARNMALLNDGALSLRNKPDGGLIARLTLQPDARSRASHSDSMYGPAPRAAAFF